MKPVMMAWKANPTFGWGILGLNVFSHWANDPALRPVMGVPFTDEDLSLMDPLRVGRILQAIRESNRIVASLPVDARVDAPVIHALGNGFKPATNFRGVLNIGRCIFEDTHAVGMTEKLSRYDALLCGSNWNADIVEAATGRRPKVIHEGVDPSLFHVAPRSGLLDPGRFYIFSGGKIEYRKAQDLVLLAFREFSTRHDDAVLVTAWHSPWPQISAGYRGRLPAPLALDGNGRLDIGKWVADNGIDPGRVLDIGTVPNPMMPAILREMDCALQPSRAEACTSLPAKEAMACGVPVILADNTGVRDLIAGDNCLALRDQQPVPATADWETAGWGESNVDEIVAALEQLYQDTELRRRIGSQGARWMLAECRDWRQHARQLKEFVLSL